MPEEYHTDPTAGVGVVVGCQFVLCPQFAFCSLIIPFQVAGKKAATDWLPPEAEVYHPENLCGFEFA